MKNTFLFSLFGILIFGFSFPVMARDEKNMEKPLWEAGLFNGAARIPHYKGADEYEYYVMPIPYLIYRGEFIRANREGVRGIFFRTDLVETDISVSGNPPVGGKSEAREGMENLDALFEIGPALKISLFQPSRARRAYLRIAARAASSIDWESGIDIAYEGIHYDFTMVYQYLGFFPEHGLVLGLKAGTDFADRKLNSYFYDVPENEARPGRPAYASSAGYTGASLALTGYKKITESVSIGTYIRWDNLNGAVIEDSPLVKTKNNLVIGFALTWKLLESETTVHNDVTIHSLPGFGSGIKQADARR